MFFVITSPRVLASWLVRPVVKLTYRLATIVNEMRFISVGMNEYAFFSFGSQPHKHTNIVRLT